MEVAINADDLTGAPDSGVHLARSGYRTTVVFRRAPIPPGKDLDVVAVDTDSRLLPAGFAAKRVVETGHAVREARIVYKKIDSTLRGPIGAELAALAATRRKKALVAPAFPSAGREARAGTQLVHGEPVHETGLSKDPVNPILESHIPSLLAHAFGNIGLADFMTERLFEATDRETTNATVMTSTFVERAKISMVLKNDREALQAAMRANWGVAREETRFVRIPNTLHLEHAYLSENLVEEALENSNAEVVGGRRS